MHSSSVSAIFLALYVLLLVVAIGWATSRRFWLQMSPRGIFLAALPGLLMVAAFFSLAAHMYFSLGGWPAGIGETGFSSALRIHAKMSESYFSALLLAAVFVWPTALLACAVFKPFRKFISHLTVFALSFLIAFGLMFLGPEDFLNWWWD